MTDADALLSGVCAEPDEDAPRLVYADWLGGQGDADRAQFIRTQCELAKLPPDDPRRAALQRRERALWRRHKKAWLEPLRGFTCWPIVFRRGFVEDVKCSAAKFLEHAERLLRVTPVLHA